MIFAAFRDVSCYCKSLAGNNHSNTLLRYCFPTLDNYTITSKELQKKELLNMRWRPFTIIIRMFVFLSIGMWNGIFMFCFQSAKKKVFEEIYSQTYCLLQFAFFTNNLRLSNWDSMNLRLNVLKIVFFCISTWIFLHLEILLYQYSAADKYEVRAEQSARTNIFYIRFSL